MSATAEIAETQGLQGQRAGIVSRLLADAVDLLVVVLLALALLLIVSGIQTLFSNDIEFVTPPQEIRSTLAGLLLIGYLAYGWGLNGRTVGKTLLGLRAVRRDGGDLSPARGLLRAVLCVLFLPGILWVAVSRRNASLQDLVLRTAVVYDWGYGAHRGASRPAR